MASSKRIRSRPAQAKEQDDDHSNSPIPIYSTDCRLPNEVLTRIAHHLQADEIDDVPAANRNLAACTLASHRFLQVFGRVLYHRVTTRDIRARTPGRPNRIRTQLLSFVKVLELLLHRSTRRECVNVAELCTEVDLIIDTESRYQCSPIVCEKVLQRRASASCQFYSPERPFRALFRGRFLTPLPPIGLYPTDRSGRIMSSPDFDHRHVIVEFSPVGCAWHVRGGIKTAITSYISVERLTLCHTPFTRSHRDGMYGWEEEEYVKPFLHDSDPSPAMAQDVLNGVGRERLCSSIALACLTVPDRCLITIVNIDQVPVWSTAPTLISGNYSRSKTGAPIIYSEAGCTNEAPDRPIEAEQHLQGRTDWIKSVTKRWLEALLRAQGEVDKLEDKWGRIKFVTLKEYLDLPESKDIWTAVEYGEMY